MFHLANILLLKKKIALVKKKQKDDIKGLFSSSKNSVTLKSYFK